MEEKKIKIDLRRLDYETLIEQRHEAGVNWVNAKIIYDRYSEGLDEFKSRIILRIAKDNPDLSRNDLLDAAKGTDEWTNFLDQKSEAQRAMLEYQNQMDTIEWQLKAKQSIMASEREEKKRI